MNIMYSIPILAFSMILAGCATSSQVQEMIDSSIQDCRAESAANEASIDLLQKSLTRSMEEGTKNADAVVLLQTRLEEAVGCSETIKEYAEASKVLSAENTVKVADLEAAAKTSQEAIDKTIRRLAEMDELYEKVMLQHYQSIVDSANVAIKSLKAEGVIASTHAPVNLDKPIEIIAPDTSAPALTVPTAE